MRTKFLRMLPYCVIFALIFYLLPLIIRDTGSAMFVMLMLMPLLAFLTSAVYGLLCGFQPLLSLLCAILFLPTVWIHYNSSALVYTLIYGVVSLLGIGLGTLFHRKK